MTEATCWQNLRAALASNPAILCQLNQQDIDWLVSCFPLWAHRAQIPPGGPWRTWLLMGGRGAGKTRAGAEYVRGLALGRFPYSAHPQSPVALIGETLHDVRAVMVEGESGILATHARRDRPVWKPSLRRLEWANGARAEIFSAEDPEALRGPQFASAWCDEIGKWPNAQAAWDNLQFALRLGEAPRAVATTTPRPTPLVKMLVEADDTALTRMATSVNAAHLAPGFLKLVEARYGGTRLGRQEIDGELILDRVDTLFPRARIESTRAAAPALERIVVAIDPPISAKSGADLCGIVAAGRAGDTAYVLADDSVGGLSPAGWAGRAIALYHRLAADCLIAEANQGGEMVRAVLTQIDNAVPVKLVHATRGKVLRAEPVAALYEQGRVAHTRPFADLEDQMADFGPGGLSGSGSPDRLDALVWALSELMLRPSGEPRIRTVI